MVDNNNDKPFSCKEKGCFQKFANFDHLVSHQKKHKMCLKLNSMSCLQSTAMLAIVDQTPTPSKILGNFLQNCEDVGLYNEITSITPIASTVSTKSNSSSINPFDVSFTNAIKNNNKPALKTPDNPRLISDSPLNTPSIFYNEGLMAIADAALNTPDHDYAEMVANNEKNLANQSSNIATIDSSLSSLSSNGSYIDNTTIVSSIDSDIKDKPSKTNNNLAKQQFQAVSVICNATTTNLINSTINQIPSIVITQPTNKDKISKLKAAINSVKANAIIAPKTKENSFSVGNTNSLYKVILKLPDGRSVQLPLVQQPISSIVTSSQSAVTSNTNPSKNSDSDTTNKDIVVNHVNIGANASQANHSSLNSLSSLSSKDSLESRERALSATLASLPPRAKPGRKSKFAPEEDPIEKKARSLERNRAAAMRCRLKRKQWIDNLEEKADELGRINEKLQNEVVSLRREVTLLKTALLAHKDCPVTQQQQQLKVTNAASNPIGNGNGIDSDGLTDHLELNGRT